MFQNPEQIGLKVWLDALEHVKVEFPIEGDSKTVIDVPRSEVKVVREKVMVFWSRLDSYNQVPDVSLVQKVLGQGLSKHQQVIFTPF